MYDSVQNVNGKLKKIVKIAAARAPPNNVAGMMIKVVTRIVTISARQQFHLLLATKKRKTVGIP